jgi:hypothetical protein
LLSRPYLACIGAAAALVLAAGPAVAATTTSPTAAPSTTVSSKPVAVAPTKSPVAISCPPIAAVTSNGQQEVFVIEPTSGSKTRTTITLPAQANKLPGSAACQELLRRKLALGFPKGAPQTGGGGRAAEVGSWR